MSYRSAERSPEDAVAEMCFLDTERQGIPTRGDAMAAERIRKAAEKAVAELGSAESTEVNLPFIAADGRGPIHVALRVRRRDLEAAGGPTGPLRDPNVKLG